MESCEVYSIDDSTETEDSNSDQMSSIKAVSAENVHKEELKTVNDKNEDTKMQYLNQNTSRCHEKPGKQLFSCTTCNFVTRIVDNIIEHLKYCKSQPVFSNCANDMEEMVSGNDSFDKEDVTGGCNETIRNDKRKDSSHGQFSGGQSHDPQDYSDLDFIADNKKQKKTRQKTIGSEKKRLKNDAELVRAPLSMGWKREIVIRNTSKYIKKRPSDIYYFAPCGKKLRSKREIQTYLNKNPHINLTLKNFTFCRYLIYREPFETERIANITNKGGKKIVRKNKVSEDQNLVRDNVKIFDKIPIVYCEKLDINLIKNKTINVKNWPFG